MAFTVESIDAPLGPINKSAPSEFDLPSKEFVGYDPKGTHTITGAPIDRPGADNVKQPSTVKGDEVEQDAPKLEESVKSEESVTLSPQISALARKEQAQRKREQALALREKELAAKLADAEKYTQLKQKIAAKDYSAAEELGMTYAEYTQHLLDKQETADPKEAKITQLEKKLEELQKNQEEQTVKEYQANQALWKEEIARVVDGNEEFSTIKDLNAYEIVLHHINDSFEEDGIELTAEQAAKEIEEELVKRAEKFASVTKIKKRLGDEPKVLGPPKPSPKTITQNMTVTSQKPSTKPLHLMSEREQWEEAARRVQAAKLQR